MKYNDITQTKCIEKYFIIVDKLKNCIFDAVIPNVFYQNLGKSHKNILLIKIIKNYFRVIFSDFHVTFYLCPYW